MIEALARGFDSALLRLAALQGGKIGKKAANAAARAYFGEIRSYLGAGRARFARMGGKFEQSLNVKYTADGAKVYSRAKHAAALEFGTRPHDIAPRRKKALRFRVARGVIITRQAIRHPGTAPHPFFFADFDARAAKMEAAVAAVLEQAAGGK